MNYVRHGALFPRCNPVWLVSRAKLFKWSIVILMACCGVVDSWQRQEVWKQRWSQLYIAGQLGCSLRSMEMKTSWLSMHAALHAWYVAGLYMQGQSFFWGSKMVGNYLVLINIIDNIVDVSPLLWLNWSLSWNTSCKCVAGLQMQGHPCFEGLRWL